MTDRASRKALLKELERIDELRRELAQKLLKSLDDRPDEPADGSVVVFRKRYIPDGPLYTYAAIGHAGKWYVTGQVRTWFSWDGLLDYAEQHDGQLDLVLATEFAPLTPPWGPTERNKQ